MSPSVSPKRYTLRNNDHKRFAVYSTTSCHLLSLQYSKPQSTRSKDDLEHRAAGEGWKMSYPTSTMTYLPRQQATFTLDGTDTSSSSGFVCSLRYLYSHLLPRRGQTCPGRYTTPSTCRQKARFRSYARFPGFCSTLFQAARHAATK